MLARSNIESDSLHPSMGILRDLCHINRFSRNTTSFPGKTMLKQVRLTSLNPLLDGFCFLCLASVNAQQIPCPIFTITADEDALRSMESSRTKLLGDAARNPHGKMQVEQLLMDRPDLQLLLQENEQTQLWIEECFGGNNLKEEILWDNREPANAGVQSECFPTQGGHPPTIRVTASKRLSSMDRLVALLFELDNIVGSKRYVEIAGQALRKEFMREEFAVAGAKLEFNDVRLFKHDLQTLQIREQITRKDLISQNYLRMPGDFELAIKTYGNSRMNPVEVWKRIFD